MQVRIIVIIISGKNTTFKFVYVYQRILTNTEIVLLFSVRVKENAALIIVRLYPQTIILFAKMSQIVDILLHVMGVRPDVLVPITRET